MDIPETKENGPQEPIIEFALRAILEWGKVFENHSPNTGSAISDGYFRSNANLAFAHIAALPLPFSTLAVLALKLKESGNDLTNEQIKDISVSILASEENCSLHLELLKKILNEAQNTEVKSPNSCYTRFNKFFIEGNLSDADIKTIENHILAIYKNPALKASSHKRLAPTTRINSRLGIMRGVAEALASACL